MVPYLVFTSVFGKIKGAFQRPYGADYEARTRYLHLGKVALYQMSYARLFCLNTEETEVSSVFGALGRNRTNDTRIFSPLLYQLSYQGKSWWERLDSNQ